MGVARDQIVDSHALAFLLRVCDAIEAFTDSQIAQDGDVFRPQGIDLRHVVERQLYFEMVNNVVLRQGFVAADLGGAPPARPLPLLLEQAAPFLVEGWHPKHHWHRRLRLAWTGPRWKERRKKFRAAGGVRVERADWPNGDGIILFHVVQAKFAPFLRPVAEASGRPWSFLVFEDPALFAQLEGQPRLHITLDEVGRRLLGIERFGLLEFFATFLNAILKALADVNPLCLVVPEGNSHYNELFNRAGHALGIPSLCIQQGWSPVIHTGFCNMSYDRMCVWGEGFAQALAPFNPGQPFVVTGSHVITPRVRRQGRGAGAIAFFLQAGGSPLITPEAAKAMLDFAIWAGEQFPGREIRVRPHPGKPLTTEEQALLAAGPNRLRVMPADTVRLAEVLDEADIAVSIFSTTILEAAAVGVIPLIVNVAGLPHYNPDIAREGAALEVTDFAAARRALVRLAGDRDFADGIGAALSRVAGRYFAGGGTATAAAIAGQIDALAAGAGA